MASCASSKWDMMPSPVVHQYLGEEVFEDMSSEEKSPFMEIFYATDRPGKGAAEEREYTNGSVDHLNLGRAVIHFGDRRMTWQDLLTLSINRHQEAIPLNLENATELGKIPGQGSEAFAKAINATLAKRKYKQLNIYVHGAQSSFFKSCVQGSQFYHFMRREGAFLSYSWPSTGFFLGYGKDVKFAAESATKFAELLEYLAENTNAKKINILAYSAGAQVLAPALAHLREKHSSLSESALRRKLRIGTAYFAAPDVSLIKFTNTYLPAFYKIVDNTTVTFHKKDSTLAWATSAHKESRVGRPDGGELTEEEIEFLIKAAREDKLDAIDMQFSPEKRPLDFKAHGHWYSNEWVSSDVIIQFLLHLRPDERGLKMKPEGEAWYFPADYPETLKRLIAERDQNRDS